MNSLTNTEKTLILEGDVSFGSPSITMLGALLRKPLKEEI
jgi:hypothetical protein